MRTEKVILYGTHFFNVLKNSCFLVTKAFGKILDNPKPSPYLCTNKKK